MGALGFASETLGNVTLSDCLVESIGFKGMLKMADSSGDDDDEWPVPRTITAGGGSVSERD